MKLRASARSDGALFALVLAVLGVVYLTSIDDVAGLYVDDGWYLLLAKGLAAGHGFTLSNAPVAGVLPFYPPGFPAVLALAFLITPAFPRNVWLLKLISLGAMLSATWLLRAYFLSAWHTSRRRASGLALLAPASPGLYFLVTSTVMSEGFFVLVQAATLLAVERCTRATSRHQEVVRAMLAGALVAASVLVRSMALPLLLAALVALLLRRRIRAALVLGVATAVVLGPWQLYTASHAPTEAERALVNDPVAYSYGDHFWLKRAGQAEFGRAAPSDLPRRFVDSLATLATSTAGSLFVYPLLRLLRGRAMPVATALSCTLAALAMIGLWLRLRAGPTVAEIYTTLSLGLLVMWPFGVDRHLLPLLPFLAGYALVGGDSVVRWLVRDGPWPQRAAAWLLGFLLAVNLAGLAYDTLDVRGVVLGPRTLWQRAFVENTAVLAWVREHIPRETVLATHNPAMVHLFTGNPTMGAWEDSTNAERWRAAHARFWVDNTIAVYRYPDMARMGLQPLMRTETLGLGVYRLHYAAVGPSAEVAPQRPRAEAAGRN